MSLRIAAVRACAALLALAVAGCANVVQPRTRVLAPLDPRLPRIVYVTTNAQREEIVSRLEQAGLRVASDARDTSIALDVKLGTVRDRRGDCGAIRNVQYVVRQGGVRTAVIVARGWTGRGCHQNVYADMNRALLDLFGPGPPPAGPADAGTDRAPD